MDIFRNKSTQRSQGYEDTRSQDLRVGEKIGPTFLEGPIFQM